MKRIKNSGQESEMQTEGDTLTLERVKTKRPRGYWVVMHNDDYTTQEFVVHVLVKYFRKSQAQATEIMLAVHTKGSSKVSLYPKDVAESKVAAVTSYARQNGMPLALTAEAE